MRHVYYVTYSASKGNFDPEQGQPIPGPTASASGFGEFSVSRRITTLAQIQEIADEISRQYPTYEELGLRLMVTNFIFLRREFK